MSDEMYAALLQLADTPAIGGRTEKFRGGPRASTRPEVNKVLLHLFCSIEAGVRRPGAWERSWVEQCFGELGSTPQGTSDVGEAE